VPAKRSKKTGKRSFLRRRWWLVLGATPLIAASLIFVGLWIAYARIELPDRLPPIRTTYLYDRNGKLITTLHGAVDRTVIPLSKMSPNLLDAVIATEDHGFYDHPGIDIRGIVRAAYTDLIKRETVQGASTITEQLVKNVYAGTYVTGEDGLQSYELPPRTIPEKIREALLAIKLEKELGKDDILAEYLNTVYFGHGAYGVEAAAQTYFGKHASQLTVLESASLAGVLHAPELYDPIDRPSDNWFRRNYAIDQMLRYGYLDAGEAEALKDQPCCGTVKDGAGDRISAPGNAEYFVEHTRQTLFDEYGEAAVYGGGLRVTTSLDLGLQRAAEQAIAVHLPDRKHDPAAALVSIDVKTGQILAMAGGRDWEHSKVNYATFPCDGCGRQAGSAFKAITLAAAMNGGFDLRDRWFGPNTIAIPDCPDPSQPDGLWHPVNAEGSGNYTLADATAHSVNTIFAQLVAQMGPEKVVDMAHLLGIRSDLSPFCSITLGSVSVNPLEMTTVYATLAGRGVRRWPTPIVKVKMPSGEVDRSGAEPGKEVLARNDADLVTYALQGVIRRGTGTAASVPGYYLAGKTGTAKENVDAWFCGYSVQIATCVWVGYPQGEIPLENVEGVSRVYGGTIPAAIWQDFMTVALQRTDPTPFPTPSFDGHLTDPATPAPSPTPSPIPCSSVSPSPGPPVPCVPDSPSPSLSPTPSPTPTPTPSPSPTPTPTASPP
jgi:penicillin-binding protein 1A